MADGAQRLEFSIKNHACFLGKFASRRQFRIIALTYYRGRTVAEAAGVLGIPPGTVKSRCYYALRALKLALAERGVTT